MKTNLLNSIHRASERRQFPKALQRVKKAINKFLLFVKSEDTLRA